MTTLAETLVDIFLSSSCEQKIGGCLWGLAKGRVILGEGRVFPARARSDSESLAVPLAEGLGALNTKSSCDTNCAGSGRVDFECVVIRSDIVGLTLLSDVNWPLTRSDKLGFFFSSLLVVLLIKVREVLDLMGPGEACELVAPFTKSDKLNWELFLASGTEKLKLFVFFD